MLLGGLQKTTLIDFPGRVACTVFTVGCNFRCPFCHNKDLVTQSLFKKSGIIPLEEKDFFNFLKKRKKVLDGVCITGGEPTLQADLLSFCQKIKKLGFEVKLDTNGGQPQVLEKIFKAKVVDFIAMDVKTAFDEYSKATGIRWSVTKIKNSLKLILKSGLEYEFRTTIVPKIHNPQNMNKLARQIKKIIDFLGYRLEKFNYFLQPFRPQNCLNSEFLKIKPFTENKIKGILKSVQSVLPQTKLRGE